MNDASKINDPQELAAEWWGTEIIDMAPNKISFRGHPIENLIGEISFVDMIWFMLVGTFPTELQSRLIGAALVAGVDHGPQAPSIAIARMAVTCGGALNNALASAVNVLDDVHGGAGEQAVQLFQEIHGLRDKGVGLSEATAQGLADWRSRHGKIIPGFGHRFHHVDPRAPKLMELVLQASAEGQVTGEIAEIAQEIEVQLARSKERSIPMNIDGATAVVFAELGLPAALARGLFCLSRSVGILAHAWEQTLQGERNKGPLPKGWLWKYRGKQPVTDHPI